MGNMIDTNFLRLQQMFIQKDKKNIEKKSNNDDEKALLDACKNMESLFINNLLSYMGKFSSTENKSMNLYQDMMNMEVSKFIAANGGIGIASTLYEQMKQQILTKKKESNVQPKKN